MGRSRPAVKQHRANNKRACAFSCTSNLPIYRFKPGSMFTGLQACPCTSTSTHAGNVDLPRSGGVARAKRAAPRFPRSQAVRGLQSEAGRHIRCPRPAARAKRSRYSGRGQQGSHLIEGRKRVVARGVVGGALRQPCAAANTFRIRGRGIACIMGSMPDTEHRFSTIACQDTDYAYFLECRLRDSCGRDRPRLRCPHCHSISAAFRIAAHGEEPPRGKAASYYKI